MSQRYQRLGPPPDEALARLMTMRETLGITRVADITGLDRLGIPVVQAVRPFSLSNVVSQGKGANLTNAAISAIMESCEAFFAERIMRTDAAVASANRLDIPAGEFDQHLQHDIPAGWRDVDVAWMAADDLVGGARTMVPLELVHTAYVLPPWPDEGIFASSTTGLAAAFEERDAVVHGILECVERDAIARAQWTHGFFQRHRIDNKTIDDPTVCELLEDLAGKGLVTGLWCAPSPIGLNVIWCHLMEDGPMETALLHHPADGSAAGFDAAGAIADAVYEAAQARLAAISGARDDITRAFYPKYPDWHSIAAHRKLLVDGPRSIDFRALDNARVEAPRDHLSTLLAMLERAGAGSVHKVRLDTGPIADLSVVRILIPGLRPLVEG
jgi:YcaO-like protein with predicted kinase domain